MRREYINYDGKHVSIAEFPTMKDRTIVVNGQAKAMPRRVGELGIAAPAFIAKACDKLQGQITSRPTRRGATCNNNSNLRAISNPPIHA